MSTLSGMKVSHKISTLMMGLVVGFLIMAVAYYAQIASEKTITEAKDNLAVIKTNSLAAQAATKEQHLALLDYLATQGVASEGKVAAELSQISLSVNKLGAMNPRYVNKMQLNSVTGAFTNFKTLFKTYTESVDTVVKDLAQNEIFSKDLIKSSEVLNRSVTDYSTTVTNLAARRITNAENELEIARTMFAVALFLTAAGTTLGLFLIYRSIVLPLWHMQGVIAQQNKGNDKARVKIRANDELGELGRAFNRLLDERISALAQQSQENDALNTSIISLIRALGTIARKDLTIKVPVSADVTGTISDAVNLLTSETALTLQEVKNISERVNLIADQLQAQSAVVMGVAEEERSQVQETVNALDQSAKTMTEIAKEARTANSIAASAIDYTQKAQQSVFETVNGIQTIRGTISETEKRIKRLGDRSQEITGIVNLINTIAERTHILALNASMHAASAGEAGKGFAVVAEEVQRLAENARGATSEISAMVNNIRVETSDTVNVMNKLITQVAEGTKLAEESGQRMHDTEAATRQLVNHVKSIAVSSMNQVGVASRVRDRANLISESTEKTAHQLVEQRAQTDDLKIAAHDLVERVSVFKLPESAAERAKAVSLATASSMVNLQQSTTASPSSNVSPTPNQAHLEKVAMGQSVAAPAQAKLA